jgi:hypothetical protein
MHDDARELGNKRRDDWGPYIGKLQASGNFQGGSESERAYTYASLAWQQYRRSPIGLHPRQCQ